MKNSEHNQATCNRFRFVPSLEDIFVPELVPAAKSICSCKGQPGRRSCSSRRYSSGTTPLEPPPSKLIIRRPAVLGLRSTVRFPWSRCSRCGIDLLYRKPPPPMILIQISHIAWPQLRCLSGHRQQQCRHVRFVLNGVRNGR